MPLADLAKPSTGGLSGRFSLVSYFPTYTAVVFVLLLLWSGAPAQTPDVGRAIATARSLDAADALLLALAITLLAVLLHPLQLPLVRLLEGYWHRRPLRWLARLGVRRQQRMWDRLVRGMEVGEQPTPAAVQEAGRSLWTWERCFPHLREDVMPTALGNALRAMEDRAGRPYGLGTIVTWPRLYPLLGDTVRAVVDDRRDAVDLTARLAATASVTGVIAAALLARHGSWLLVALVPLLLAWVAYRSAVVAAMAYGEAVRVAFDLHRLDLYAALHLEVPHDPQAERKLGASLSDHWRQGVELDLAYQHPEKGSE
jgi:hypothetical protein